MGNISLLAWSKKFGVTYSRAQKLVSTGVLLVERAAGRVLIQEDLEPPFVTTIPCEVCGKELPQITASHLKFHQLTIREYKEQYPNAKIVSSDISKILSDTAKSLVRDEVYRENMSKARSGVIPINHPRHQPGTWSPSEETRALWSEQRTGHLVTEETRKKIGDSHRGIPESEDAKAKTRSGLLKYFETHDAAFKGMTHTDMTKQIFSRKAKIREQNNDPEYRKQRARNGGLHHPTPEQKENYRRGRIAYMKANPHTLKPSKAELIMEKWLEDKCIDFRTQCFIENHPYDFYLPEHKILIEMDGAHHWDQYWVRINMPERNLDQQFEKDAVENLIAGKHGYKIYRVRYRILPGDSEWGSIEEQLDQQCFLSLRSEDIHTIHRS